jgi:hypothetical protein
MRKTLTRSNKGIRDPAVAFTITVSGGTKLAAQKTENRRLSSVGIIEQSCKDAGK